MAFITDATRKVVIDHAVATLGRAPSAAELAAITKLLNNNASLADVADYLTSSEGYLAKYPLGQTAKEVSADILDAAIVGGVLAADIRLAAIDLIAGGLTAGTYTIASATNAVVAYLSDTANNDNADLGDIAKAFQNRTAAAEEFTTTFTLEGATVTEADLAAAVEGVTSDAATLTAAKAAFAAGSKSIAEQAVVDAAAEEKAAEEAAAKATEEKAAADAAAAEKALEDAATEAAATAATAIEAAEEADAAVTAAQTASDEAAATAAETDAEALATALETATTDDTDAKAALETASEAYDAAIAAGDATAVVTANGNKLIAQDKADKAAAALVEATTASEEATAADAAAATAATALTDAIAESAAAADAADAAAAAAVEAAAATADEADDEAAAAQVVAAAAANPVGDAAAEAAAEKAAEEKAAADKAAEEKAAADQAAADKAAADKAAADAAAAADALKQTLTLTTDAETLTGGIGDDRFVAVTIGEGGTGSTLLPGDVIDGGAGTDKLLLSTSGTYPNGDYTVAAIQASNLEVVHVNGFDTDTDDTIIDLTLMGTSIEEVGLAASNETGDVSFVNPRNFVDATMNNGSADLTVTYGTLAIGTSDVQNLSLANVSAGTATFASVETVNVSTSLANSKLTDLVIDGATALNISGDKKLTIASDVNFKDNASSTAIDGTIDASASTGGVDLTFSSADNLAITGGSGDDVIRMGTSKNLYDAIDGGDGDDTVTISLGAASGAGIAYSYALTGLSNVENLDVTSTDDNAEVDMEGISADITNVTLGSNVRTLTVGADLASAGDDVTFVLNGTTYELKTADGTTTAAELGAELATAINALTGFTAVATDGSTEIVTVTSTSGNAVEFGAVTNTTADPNVEVTTTVGAYTEAAITNLPDDGSVSVTLHSADDVTLGLADGSGSSDVVNLKLGTVTADKGFEKTVKSVKIAAVETLNIDVSGMTDKIDTNITTLEADSKLTAINITGDSDLDMTGTITATKLATIDASAATGDVAIDVPALTGGSTVKGGSGKDNFVFEGALGLSAYDVVTGGEGTDKLSASIAGMTGVYAPLGALNVTDVETLNLTTTASADASIDATGIVGATEVGISGAGGTTTLSNLAAGVNLGLGINGSDSNTSGRVDVSLADATGTEDALTVKLNDRDGGTNNAIDLRASGIETVTFTVSGYSTDAALADHTLTVNRLNAKTINVTGSTRDADNTLSLGTLDTDTTTVDASTYNGLLTAAAGTGVGVSISAKGDRVHTLTGSTGDDTFTLVGTVTDADSTIVGGGGNDTLNLTVGAGEADFDGVTNVDTINMTVLGGSAVTTNATATSLDGINESSKLVVTGGNSLASVTLGGTGDAIDGGSKTNVLDFSGFGGSATVVYAANGFDDLELGYTQQVIGGASLADTIIASYGADTDASVAINTQGVEAFQFTLADSDVELVMDMTKVTGMGQINVLDTSSESVEIANLMAGTKVYAETTTSGANTVVEVKLASTSGSEDALTLGAAAASANDDLKFVVADVETVTIASLGKLLSNTDNASNEVDLDLSEISMTATGATTKVVLTGGVALEVVATNADIATIDASARTAGVVQTARSAETGSTYTGGSGADTFIMMSGSDVLTGGLGSDTLDVNLGAVLGGISVDLSSETNQVASMDGGAISGTVLGFENVDLSGYSGFGAVVQAIKTGSTITGTDLTDRITGGASADTVRIITTASLNADVVNGGGGSNTLFIADDIADGAESRNIINLSDFDGSKMANVDAFDKYSNFSNVDASANDTGSDDFTLVGTTGANTLTGGAGEDLITGAGGADTLDGGSGNDDFIYLLTADLFASGTTVDTQIKGGEGTSDEIVVGTTGTAFAIAATDIFDGVTTVESIRAVANTKAVTIDLDVSAYTAGIRKVDISAADSGNNGSNVIDISEFVGTEATVLIGADGTGTQAITGGAGADEITGGGGIDTIKGGGGADIVTGGLGADTIDLTEEVAAADDVIITSGLASDTVTAFAEDLDDVLLDMSALEAAGAAVAETTVDIVEIYDALSVTDADGTPVAVGVQVLTEAGTAADAKNFFVIDLGDTKFADAAAAVDALEADGAAALTFAGNIAAGDGFFFAYENATGGTGIALATFVEADNNSGADAAAPTGADNLVGTDLVTLSGVADATVIDATNLFFF